MDIERVIASELRLRPDQVKGAVALLRAGASVPFLAHYKREDIGSLDERRLFSIQDRLGVLDELNARRSIILNSIRAQNKLDKGLKAQVDAAVTRVELEDIYLPFSPNRRDLAKVARTQGLEPLADIILKQEAVAESGDDLTVPFLNAEKDVKEAAQAFEGARKIVAQNLAESCDFRKAVRKAVRKEALLTSKVRTGAEIKGTRHAEISEPVHKIGITKLLSLIRGASDKKIILKIEVPIEKILENIQGQVIKKPQFILADQLAMAVQEALKDHLLAPFEDDLLEELKSRAESFALDQCARSLRALLFHPPLGLRPVLAIASDGKKALGVVVLDALGKVVESALFALGLAEDQQKALDSAMVNLLRSARVEVIAIAHGPQASKIKAYCSELLKANGIEKTVCVVLSDVGLAPYANSQPAKEEFPELAPASRAAISLARRLQEPLAEFVKANPKLLLSGISSHDLNSRNLRKRLEQVFTSCVNLVGVNVNAADARLLVHVSGVSEELARNIVSYREAHGPFGSRADLKSVPGMTDRIFEQCAGFLRVRMGANPLDDTAIHPACYPLVQQMAESVESKVDGLVGQAEALGKINLSAFKSDQFGEPTLKHILRELRHQGRDPRGPFVAPRFDPQVATLADLAEGQVLSGIVTSHSAFGIFFDVGVGEEGLVHVTELSRRHLHDPARFLPVGRVTRVKIVSVDQGKKRIGLSIKALESEVGGDRRHRVDRAEGRKEKAAENRVSGDRRNQSTPSAPRDQAKTKAKEGAASGRKGGGRDTPKDAGKYASVTKDGKRMPDFSKFFAKGTKKKDGMKKDTGKGDTSASRKDVMELMRNQSSRSASTLGDLLRKAGVNDEEK